jgi:hypothetical protein
VREMERSKIAKLVSIILKLIFACGVISLFFVPYIYDAFSDAQVLDFAKQSAFYKVAFYFCAVVSLGIVYELIKIFNDVYNGSPFKKPIEIGLKKIAVSFMILAIVVGIKIIFIPSILSVAVSFITFIASLSFYVLSQVFKVAIEYKDEIDFTV